MWISQGSELQLYLHHPSSALPIHSEAFREDRGFTSIGSVVQKAAHQETATGAVIPVQRAMSVMSRKEGVLFSGQPLLIERQA